MCVHKRERGERGHSDREREREVGDRDREIEGERRRGNEVKRDQSINPHTLQ